MIGADRLVYQNLDDLIAAAQEGNPHIDGFDCSVFNGEYITGDIDDDYLDALQAARNDAAKKRKNGDGSEAMSTIVDLSNGN